ncbi:MAG: hypothetical protein U5L96_21735 [Owenweeksia sp.]|nr:hypothetical protein [Owenweeksia sp.]
MATQGLANYLKGQSPGQSHEVAIAYDSRHNSRAFATQIADVLAANDIGVYLFEDLRPTPELFLCHPSFRLPCGHYDHRFAQPARVQWVQGVLAGWRAIGAAP